MFFLWLVLVALGYLTEDWSAIVHVVVLPLVLVVIHEWLHALACRWTGGVVHEIRLGWGEARWRFRLGRVRMRVAQDFTLGGGLCVATFERPTRPRLALFVGAPLLFHLAAALVTLPCLLRLAPRFLAWFCVWNAWYFVAAAWPRTYDHPARPMHSDGLALKNLVLRGEKTLGFFRMASFLVPAYYAVEEGRDEEAVAWAEQAVEASARNRGFLGWVYWATGRYEAALDLQREVGGMFAFPDEEEAARAAVGQLKGERMERYMRASILLWSDRLDEALAAYATGVETETLEEARAIWSAGVAFTLFLKAEDPDRALEAAEAAYRALPWLPFVRSALAGVRISRGEVEKALPLIQEEDKSGINPGLRAVAHARSGRSDLATRELEQARGAGSPPALVRLATDDVG